MFYLEACVDRKAVLFVVHNQSDLIKGKNQFKIIIKFFSVGRSYLCQIPPRKREKSREI